MTSQKLVTPKKLGKLEAHATEIITMLLDGTSQRDVAAHFGGTLRGIQLLAERHEEDLTKAKEAASAVVVDNWIVDKARRIAELQWLYEQTKAEASEYGLTIVEERHEQTDGDGATVITKTRDYRASMVKEMRGLLKDAAIEEGQIVPAAPNKGGMVREVIIREYEGAEQYL